MIRWKVVLVPFPFDDLTTTKVRPAVCQTDSIDPYGHVVLAFISSRVPEKLSETELKIDANHRDFHITGLRVSSIIKLHRLMTVSKSLIKRELGMLPSEMQDEVRNKLRILFDL